MITVLPGVVGIAVFAEGAIEVRYPDMYMYQYCLMRALKDLFVIYTRCVVGYVAGTLREGQSRQARLIKAIQRSPVSRLAVGHTHGTFETFSSCRMDLTKSSQLSCMLILILYLSTLALSSAHDQSAGLSIAPNPIIRRSQAPAPLHNRDTEASSSLHHPLVCLRLVRLTNILPVQEVARALTALYSVLHAGASNSWANTPYPQFITVKYGGLQLEMDSPLTSIPWSFVASFAMEMLQAIPRGGMAVSLYEGFYSSPASCTGLWDAVYATAQGANFVWVALTVVD